MWAVFKMKFVLLCVLLRRSWPIALAIQHIQTFEKILALYMTSSNAQIDQYSDIP
ncbi:MAG: hypothetical protein A4E48_01481 [Methanosaeta sp. PtaU1.Bin060]|nr:MAG: hypothetical protein A4E48_01481 [Methanosaeta sp. PtaU1.Bin060]